MQDGELLEWLPNARVERLTPAKRTVCQCHRTEAMVRVQVQVGGWRQNGGPGRSLTLSIKFLKQETRPYLQRMRWVGDARGEWRCVKSHLGEVMDGTARQHHLKTGGHELKV